MHEKYCQFRLDWIVNHPEVTCTDYQKPLVKIIIFFQPILDEQINN